MSAHIIEANGNDCIMSVVSEAIVTHYRMMLLLLLLRALERGPAEQRRKDTRTASQFIISGTTKGTETFPASIWECGE